MSQNTRPPGQPMQRSPGKPQPKHTQYMTTTSQNPAAQTGATQAKPKANPVTRQQLNQRVRAAANSLRNSIRNQSSKLAGAMSGGFADTQGMITDVGQRVDTGFANMDTGFADMGTRFDGVDQGIADTQGMVDSLGQFAQGRFNQTDAAIGQMHSGMNSGFAGVADQLTSSFGDMASQIGDAQAAVLDGQNQLQGFINDNGQKLDTYYGGLADGQTQLQDTMDTMGGDLGDFRDAFDTNAQLATQARADLQTGMMGGFNAVHAGQSAQQSGIMGLMQSVGGPAAAPAQQAPAQDLPSRINSIRQMLSQSGDAMPPQLRNQYTALVSSFDLNGQVIPRSTDAAGNIVTRQAGPQGSLDIRYWNQTGQPIGGMSLDVNRMLQAAGNLQAQPTPYTQG